MPANLPLIIFDIIILPIIIIRLIIIYFFGSKYSISNMNFLDVMFHSDNPYFNQESNNTVDVLNEDIRSVIKRDTLLYIEPENIIDDQKKCKTNLKPKKKIKETEEESDEETEDEMERTNESDEESDEETERTNETSEEESEEKETDETEDDVKDTSVDNDNIIMTDGETSENHGSLSKDNFKLDVHVNKLLKDLENSVSIMTQTQNT